MRRLAGRCRPAIGAALVTAFAELFGAFTAG